VVTATCGPSSVDGGVDALAPIRCDVLINTAHLFQNAQLIRTNRRSIRFLNEVEVEEYVNQHLRMRRGPPEHLERGRPMEIVLGLSVTGTSVRLVLVEGERADGVTIESEGFDTAAPESLPKPSPTEQVSNAILATQQNALANGHHLVVSGVTWDRRTQEAELRESMIARGLDDVVLVPEQTAAGALAQTIGRALGYDTTAVLLIQRDTATLSIVKSADGSIAEGLPHTFCGANVADVIPEILTSLEPIHHKLRGIVIVGSRVETGVVKSKLESLLAVPVIAPEEPELSLARGAALAAASAVGLEAPTVGRAYSQDPDGNEVRLSAADTMVSPPLASDLEEDNDVGSVVTRLGRAVLNPIGSLVAGVCVLGVVALMMSLAFSISTTTAQNEAFPEAENAAAPNAVVSTPAPARDPAVVSSPVSVPQAQAFQPPPSSASPEPIQVAAAPPVAAPVIASAPQPAARTPVAKRAAPSRLITPPSPVVAEAPYTEAPVAVQPPPAEPQPVVAPAAALPPVAVPPPPVAVAPVLPPSQTPGFAFPSGPPILRLGPLRIPLGPTQPAAQLPQQQAPQAPVYSPPQAPVYSPPQSPVWTPPQAPLYSPPQAPVYSPPQAPVYSPPQSPVYSPPQAPVYSPPQAPLYSPPQAPVYSPPQSTAPGPRGHGDSERWWPWG
jgi:hypothetical protein